MARTRYKVTVGMLKERVFFSIGKFYKGYRYVILRLMFEGLGYIITVLGRGGDKPEMFIICVGLSFEG